MKTAKTILYIAAIVACFSASNAVSDDKIPLAQPTPVPQQNVAIASLSVEQATALLAALQAGFFDLPPGKTASDVREITATRARDGSAVVRVRFWPAPPTPEP